MLGNLVKLVLGETVEGDMKMRTGDIAAGLETRPVKKIFEPFRNFGVLSNGG